MVSSAMKLNLGWKNFEHDKLMKEIKLISTDIAVL